MSINKFQIIGNVTRDRHVRYTPEVVALEIFVLGVNPTPAGDE